MRCEGRQGRPTAPRGASLLEMGTYRNGDSGELFRRRRITAKCPRRPSGASEWSICHRDIVNLTTRRRLARRHSSGANWRRCHDSIQPHCRHFRQADSWLPLGVSPRGRSPGHRKWQTIRRADNPTRPVRATAGHCMMVPANASPKQRTTQRAKSVRIRNA